RQAAQRSQQDMDARLQTLCAREVPGDTQRNLQVQRAYQGRTFKHTLVPVWLVSYTYGAKSFQVLANGHTGALAGEHPYSWTKITFAALAVLLLLVIVILASQ